jgi:hypothetical protein
MGILPTGFWADGARLPNFSVHRGPFRHRDKKGPAICRAFSDSNFLGSEVPILGRFLLDH